MAMIDDQIVELLKPKFDLLKLLFDYFLEPSKSKLELLVVFKHELLAEILPENVEELRKKYGHSGAYQARIETDQAMVLNSKLRAAIAKIDAQLKTYPEFPGPKS